MCEPITILAVSTALAVAGGAVAADAQMKAGAYQAQVAKNQAKMVKDAAAVEEQQSREKTAQTISAQRAQYAAHGIDPNLASAADVQVSTAMIGELDALTIRTNAKNQAAGIMDQGRAAKALGNAQAWSTALSTAGQVAGSWASFGQAEKLGAGAKTS